MARAKESAFAVASRSMGKLVPASAAAPSGDLLSRALASAKRPRSRAEHLDISEEVMAEGDRLRGLQMGEARHDGGGMDKRRLGKRKLQHREQRVDGVDLVPHIEAEIGRHLIVARSCRMQLAGDRSDQLGEPRLSTLR